MQNELFFSFSLKCFDLTSSPRMDTKVCIRKLWTFFQENDLFSVKFIETIRVYSFGISESSEFWKRQTLEPSTTRNHKNENSENSRARNESYFHWLKTGDDEIFVVRYSNHIRPTGSLFTKSEISAKSTKPSSSWGRRLWSLRNLPFFREMPKRIRFRCLRSLREPEEAETCTKRIHPKISQIFANQGWNQ